MASYPRGYRPRRNAIPLKSRWKFDFATSTSDRAKVIHQLDHERHEEEYQDKPVMFFPHANNCKGQFVLTAFFKCGTRISLRLAKGLTLEQANILVADGMRTWCVACDRATEGKWITDARGNRSKANG